MVHGVWKGSVCSRVLRAWPGVGYHLGARGDVFGGRFSESLEKWAAKPSDCKALITGAKKVRWAREVEPRGQLECVPGLCEAAPLGMESDVSASRSGHDSF